jgi:hypothetical protein
MAGVTTRAESAFIDDGLLAFISNEARFPLTSGQTQTMAAKAISREG